MIRLESGGSDCTMEAGFRENSVYSAYTPLRQQNGLEPQIDDFPGKDQEYQPIRIFGKDTYHRMPYY